LSRYHPLRGRSSHAAWLTFVGGREWTKKEKLAPTKGVELLETGGQLLVKVKTGLKEDEIIPYFAQNVFVVIDYSRISKEPLPHMRPELESMDEKKGIRQFGSPDPEMRVWGEGLATITATSVPKDSEVVLRWNR
jgi:hypothetical protein